MRKQNVFHDPASHSHSVIRDRSCLLPDVQSCRHSQCAQLDARPCPAHSRRRLDRRPDGRSVRHHPHYLHWGATTRPLWRSGGGPLRHQAPAPSPGVDLRARGPSHRDRLHAFPRWRRLLDLTGAGRPRSRPGMCRVHVSRNHPQPVQNNARNPWQHEQWCIPEGGAACVAAMDDGLDLHEEEDDPRSPVVNGDEKRVTRHADVRTPLPPEPGTPARIDEEDERLGTATLFFVGEPLAGWRPVDRTERRTTLDAARQRRWVVDRVSPEAEAVRMVQDHRKIPPPAAIAEAFPPEDARRLLRRVAFHSTPTHGRWLNRADIDIGRVQRGYLSRRVDGLGTVRRRLTTLEMERHRARRTISWQCVRMPVPHVLRCIRRSHLSKPIWLNH